MTEIDLLDLFLGNGWTVTVPAWLLSWSSWDEAVSAALNIGRTTGRKQRIRKAGRHWWITEAGR